ncbi:MAG TPA: GDSL-type esterase/lipase family protein [Xanthobacteraceae bacterium]|nr:GDSL-type esterase/lipase family protein [Xanthobacteraceae bacterium]
MALCVAAGTLAPLPAAAQLLDFLFRPRGGQVYEVDPRYRQRPVQRPTAPAAAAPADSTRAPAPEPRKADIATTTKVVVLGDSLSDWLAYGLEDAWAEAPENEVLRRNRAFSGLIRYDSKGDTTWAQTAREIVKAEKPDFVVMLVGIADRRPIQPRTARRVGDAHEAEAQNGEQAGAEDDDEAASIVAREPQGSGGALAYRTEAWAEAYGRLIDDTMTALKSSGAPVLWVGIPSILGTRSTSDAQYLNGLYRAAAEKNGVVYVDLWDGFVDENGRFTRQGPDVDGQIRRLRTQDGVHFTLAGARKMAFYVDREILRLRSGPAPVALVAPSEAVPEDPSARKQPDEPQKPAGPRARALAGPVLPLTAMMQDSEELLGGQPSGRSGNATLRPLAGGGGAPAGRADDATWPRSAIDYVEAQPGATPVVAVAAPPKDMTKTPARSEQAKAKAARPRPAGPPVAVSGPPQPAPPRSAFGSFFGLFR